MNQKENICRHKLMIAQNKPEVIEGKWWLPIIIALTFGEKRFGELQREIVDISPKMLSQQLKALEDQTLVYVQLIRLPAELSLVATV